MSADVAIVGCGYVGLELGRRLVAAGRSVVGVRRSDAGLEAIERAGIEPVRADVTDPATLDKVPPVGAVVYAVSAGTRDPERAMEVYVGGLQSTIEVLGDRPAPPERLVYTSSTGAFGDHGGAWVDETTDPNPVTVRERTLLAAERVALEYAPRHGIDATVARLAGLYGPDRYRLDRYLDGPVVDRWLNLVHRDDAAGAVSHLLETDRCRDEVVVVVDDEPVRRATVAAWLAEHLGVEVPSVREAPDRPDGGRGSAQKRCSNRKLRSIGYDLRYPTFREGFVASGSPLA